MEYGYHQFNIPLKKDRTSGFPKGFAMLIPEKGITKEEMKEYTKRKLQEIIEDRGVLFYELQKR